jgi:hypothetical protein
MSATASRAAAGLVVLVAGLPAVRVEPVVEVLEVQAAGLSAVRVEPVVEVPEVQAAGVPVV